MHNLICSGIVYVSDHQPTDRLINIYLLFLKL